MEGAATTKLAVVLVGAALGSLIVWGLARDRKERHEDNARAAIPLAASAAQGPAVALNEAEVAAAYHAYFGGAGDARAEFAEIVRKLAKPIDPGLPVNLEIVAPEGGRAVVLRPAAREAGSILADITTGKLLAWTSQGTRALSGDPFGPLVFEERADDSYTILDVRAGKLVGDLDGSPAAASGNGAVLLFTRAEGDAGLGTVLRVWDVRAAREKRPLAFPVHDAEDSASISASQLVGGPAVVVASEDGRWVAAAVDLASADRPTRLAVWDASSGRIIARPALYASFVAALFAPDERAIYAMVAAPPAEEQVGVARIRLPDGALEGPFADCDSRSTALLDGRALALSSDGKYLAVGGTEATCVYQASPLRFLWKTPILRPLGPDDDMGGTWPRFVLGDKVLLVTTDGPPSIAAFKTSDHSEIARGPIALSLPDRIRTTRSVTDKRMLVVLEDATGAPTLFDVDATGAARTRKLTTGEREGHADAPELVGAPPDLHDAQARAERARELIAKRVCHVGELVLPPEACGG
jgi:hypothetical protein